MKSILTKAKNDPNPFLEEYVDNCNEEDLKDAVINAKKMLADAEEWKNLSVITKELVCLAIFRLNEFDNGKQFVEKTLSSWESIFGSEPA